MAKFDLYFETQGDEKGIPIIFIHAFPMTHSMWEPQLKKLPEKYFAITYDIRGLGKSPIGDAQFTMEMYVDDLLALLNHLKIRAAILCGLSLGGYIALRFAEKYSKRVLGLVLCNTRSEGDTNEAKLNRANTIKTIKNKGLSFFSKNWVPQIVAEKTRLEKPEVLLKIQKIVEEQNPLAVCGGQLALISRTDTTDFLSKITCPSLVIHGEEDNLIPVAQAKRMSEKIPQGKWGVIPKAGHVSNLENPKLFNQYLLEFLEIIF